MITVTDLHPRHRTIREFTYCHNTWRWSEFVPSGMTVVFWMSDFDTKLVVF